MQNITFKGNDYSKLYKEMEKITLHREEKFIPKNTLINKTSNNIQEKANKVNDVFVSKNKPENFKIKDNNSFNNMIVKTASSALSLGKNILKLKNNDKEVYKALIENKDKFNQRITTYNIQYQNNEITHNERIQKVEKAIKEFRTTEQKLLKKINGSVLVPSEKLKTKDRNLFGTMVNTLVAVAISATLILGGKVLKFNYDHKDDYKILKDNKNKFNEKVNAYLMQYYNNEISSQECEQKIKKATNEFKAVEQKINNKINKE